MFRPPEGDPPDMRGLVPLIIAAGALVMVFGVAAALALMGVF